MGYLVKINKQISTFTREITEALNIKSNTKNKVWDLTLPDFDSCLNVSILENLFGGSSRGVQLLISP